MKISFPASVYVIDALRSAIKECEETVKNCGKLCMPDTALTASTKAYFAEQEKETQDCIKELREIIKQIETV